MLKKSVYIISIVCLFVACDDGDVSVSSLNIDPSTAFTCDVQNPFPLYNIDQNEVLILNLNNSLFAPQVTGDAPRTASLNSGQVIYRFFTDNVNQGFFCSVIPPLDPKPVEEFLSTGGIAEISTRLNTNELGDTISFTHDVVLLNLSLEQGDRQIRREELFYGFITIPKQ